MQGIASAIFCASAAWCFVLHGAHEAEIGGLLDRFDYCRVAVAEQRSAKAGAEVDVLVAIDVPHAGAFAACHVDGSVQHFVQSGGRADAAGEDV